MALTGKRAAYSFIAALVVAACGAPIAAHASAFVAWMIADVPAGDVLMVREGPDAQAPILVGYPAGITLSMTGRCTGGVRLDRIQTLSEAEQRATARSVWCELWFDPYGTGEFRSGWVSGRYIKPA